MSVIKGIVLADIHIGAFPMIYQQNDLDYVVDVVDAYSDVLDFGVICGDLFDYKNYASSKEFRNGVSFLFELLCNSNPNTEWHVIEGTRSHDALQTNTLESMFDWLKDYIEVATGKEDLPKIYFHSKVESVDIKGLKCLMIPEEYVVDQDSYYKEPFSHYYDFIFGHGMTNMMYYAEKKSINHVPGAPVFEVEKLTSICNYAFFGHVHTHKTMGRFESIGPVSRWEFGNPDAGFDIVYYDTESQTADIRYMETMTACTLETVTLNLDKDLSTEELDKELARIVRMAEPGSIYKLRIIVFMDDSVENAAGIRIYLTEYIDKYPKISILFKQGTKFFEEDGTEVEKEDMDLDEELSQLLSDRDDVTVQKFIEMNHGERIGLETIQTIIGYKED